MTPAERWRAKIRESARRLAREAERDGTVETTQAMDAAAHRGPVLSARSPPRQSAPLKGTAGEGSRRTDCGQAARLEMAVKTRDYAKVIERRMADDPELKAAVERELASIKADTDVVLTDAEKLAQCEAIGIVSEARERGRG